MAITVVQNPAAVGANTDTPSITLTSTTVEADDYIFWWANAANDITVTVPSGFTEICAVLDSSTGNDHTSIAGYLKCVGSEESTTYASETAMTVAAASACGAIVLRGVDTTTPIDVTATHGTYHLSAENDPNPTLPSITTVTDGAMVIALSGIHLNNATPTHTDASSDSGDAVIAKVIAQIQGTQQWSHLATREIIATAGAVGGDVHTYENGGGTSESFTHIFAIRPAAAASGGTLLQIMQHYY